MGTDTTDKGSDTQSKMTTFGEIVVLRQDDHVELSVSCALLSKPHTTYAYSLTEPLQGFCEHLAAHAGCTAGQVELMSASGASMSTRMNHSFAWKPGRWLALNGKRLEVTFVFADASAAPQLLRKPSVGAGGTPPTKYVVVTGGVVSGLGKGVTASSLGVLLKASGYRVTSIKIDPYLNVDAGTMSPFEHGEVFTLEIGRAHV